MLITTWTADKSRQLLIRKSLLNYFSNFHVNCGRNPLIAKKNPHSSIVGSSLESKIDMLKMRASKAYHGFSLAVGQLEENNYCCIILAAGKYFQGTTAEFACKKPLEQPSLNNNIRYAIEQAAKVYSKYKKNS